MNKAQFMRELERRMSALPAAELKKSLEYYSEIIDDRVEDGMSEEEAVRALGDMDDIAREAMRDVPEPAETGAGRAEAAGESEKMDPSPDAGKPGRAKELERKEKPKKRSVWKKIALALTFPVWLPVMIAFWCIAAAFYICLWALVLSAAAADIACLAGGAAGVVFACLLFPDWFLTGLLVFGCALVLFGLGLFFLPLTWKFCRGAARATAWSFRRRRRRRSGGGDAR